MNNQQPDQGIEKIPHEFRNSCWNKAVETIDDKWEAFRVGIMQIRLGGVSSEAEAKRLFRAEQIGKKQFFEKNTLPSNIANQLSMEIQEGFQNLSRPVSTSQDPEVQIVEILNYYFPSEDKLKNFELALHGTFDEQRLEASQASPNENIDENDFVFESKELIEDKNADKNIPENIAYADSVQNTDSERSWVQAYLQSFHNVSGKEKTKKPEFSERIKEIIDEHYAI